MKVEVQSRKQKTLFKVIRFADMFESTKGKSQFHNKIIIYGDSKSDGRKIMVVEPPSSTTTLEVRKMSPHQLHERKELGLCFYCDEKYSKGHKCKKLFLIERVWEPKEDGIPFESDLTEISFNALTGSSNTMRIQGKL